MSQNKTSEGYLKNIRKASVSHLEALYGLQMVKRWLRDALERVKNKK
jgi:hypothetical protein